MKMPEHPALPKPFQENLAIHANSESTATVFDTCLANIQHLLDTRLIELEKRREAINDRYPFDDLILQWELVDTEKEIIMDIMQHLRAMQQGGNQL